MTKLVLISDIETPSYRFFNASSKTSFTDTSSSPSQASLIRPATFSTSSGTILPSVFVIFMLGTSGISISIVSFFLSCVLPALYKM